MGHDKKKNVFRKEFYKRKIKLQLTETNTSVARVSDCDRIAVNANYVGIVYDLQRDFNLEVYYPIHDRYTTLTFSCCEVFFFYISR